jgi:thioredoxin-related protein
MKKLLVITLLAMMSMSAMAQEKINWMSIEEAEARCVEEPRMIFIDVYTDWCGWCKRMDKSTFANPVIAKYMNEHFYNVKLNAETSDTISFQGQHYVGYVREDGRQGSHRLARTLLNGRMSYPSYVSMNEEMRALQVIPGYQNEKAFEPMMHFFGDKVYLEMSSEDFLRDFKSELEPEEAPDQKQ